MANLTVRNLDESLKASLRLQAAEHGVSMEEEVRVILRDAMARRALRKACKRNIAEEIHSLFAPLGGVDLPDLPRETDRDPPDFGKW